MSSESDIGGRGDDEFVAAEYALGILPQDEHERVRARLAAEPALRADLAFWRGRLSGLDAEFAETAPPSHLWGRIEQRLFTGQAKAGWWHSLALWRGLAAGAMAVAAVAVALNLTAPRPDPRAFAAELVAALHQEGSNVSFVALYNAQSGQMRLTALSGDTMSDNDYELWAIEGDAAPKSMGVVNVASRNEMTLPSELKVEFGEGTVLAITVERKGGSPTGAPEGPVVASGKAQTI